MASYSEKKSRRILIVIPNDNLYGAENVLKMIALYLAKRDCIVDVVFLRKNTYKGWDNCNEQLKLHFPIYKNEKIGYFFRIPYLIIRAFTYSYDISFTSHIHLNALIGVLKKIKLIRINQIVFRESTSAFKRFKGSKLRLIKILYFLGYYQDALIIAQTNFMREQLASGIIRGKQLNIQVLPNPFSLHSMELKGQQGINLEQFDYYAVTAGRMIPEKGFDNLIEAFYKVTDQNEHLNLVLIGDGPEKDRILQIAKSLSISDRIFFLGQIDNPLPYFKHAKVCVISSLIEGFPNVLLEMMSQNERVVSTICTPDIENIKGLITCNPNDKEALTRCIQTGLELKENELGEARIMFDNYLRDRTIDSYMSRILSFLNYTLDR